MPHLTRRHAGFSIIELMVVVTLIGLLLVMAGPQFGKWVADSRVRSTAESLVNSLRTAQATAVARNRISMVGLTTSTPAYNATVADSTGPVNWFTTMVPLTGSDEAASSAGLFVEGITLAKKYDVSIGASGTGAAAPAVTCFNSLGQQTTLTATQTGLALGCTSANPAIYWVTSSKATRKFKVLVYPGGRIRMCDALKSLSNTDPDGCP